MMKIEELMVQGLSEPLGLSTEKPVFRYILKSMGKNNSDSYQTAFRLLAASTKALLEQNIGDLWDSGIQKQKETFGILYQGKPLQSRQRVYWKVFVWDQKNDCVVSDSSFFEMGLFGREEWMGYWIGQGDGYLGSQQPCCGKKGIGQDALQAVEGLAQNSKKSCAPLFAKEFFVEDWASVERARLYLSGLGLYQASINGQKLADTVFDPGESDAEETVYYVVYDVGKYLQEGANVLGVVLGNGQYTNFQFNPVMAWNGTLLPEHRYQKNDGGFVKPGISGEKKFIAQLELFYQSGERKLALVSDESWTWEYGPTVFQNWYGGEDYDATLEIPGWDMPSIDRTNQKAAQRMEEPRGKLTAREFPPVQIMERIYPKEVRKLSSNRYLVDMGRNGAGFPEIRLHTKEEMRGMWIKLYPAETLKEDKNGVDQASCTQSWNETYHCKIQDAYRMKGTGLEVWHPSFCYQGFQYLEVEGWPGELQKNQICFCIVRAGNQKKGSFCSSNTVLNQINDMVEHSIESNMFFAFTDCPQIEKLGWIETSHLMFRSIADCYDIYAWMRKIIFDIRDAQVDKEQEKILGNEPEGYVPAIIPEYQRIVGLHRDPNWNGACIFTPWEFYCFYGERMILEQTYPMMKKYISYLSNYVKNNVLSDYAQMGEWGEIGEHTPTVLVATCSYYRMLCILAEISQILGMGQEGRAYKEQAEKTKRAFFENHQCYNKETGIYGSGSQASYGCALFSGLVPEEKKQAVVGQLVEAIERNQYHLSSGEVGLKQVFVSLAENGRNDIVYKMVMNETAPSYRFFAEQGMTALPEYWNCDELWNGMQRSRNHAMMGHVKEWISRYLLGVQPLEAGYKRVRVTPYLPEGMKELKGSVYCPFGMISVACSWDEENHTMIQNIDLPPGVQM